MVLTLDTEITTWSKGNAFDRRNHLVCISYRIERPEVRFAPDFGEVETYVKSPDTLVVGFNIKFDLHWLRKLFGYVPSRVWDCQLAEFFINRQSPPYPDLDSVALKYTGVGKSKVIEEYWDRGINTDEIPRDVIAERALLDVELTHQVYLKQRELIQPHQQRLFSLMCQDLLVLEEMEWNGLQIEEELAEKKAQEIAAEISALQTRLNLYHNVSGFNWASNDHLSALLYGGQITQVDRVPNGIYKSGQKQGLPKFERVMKEYKLPRVFKPIRGSETSKEGVYSVEESFLRKLKGNDSLIQGILKIKELETLINRYLRGIPKLRSESHWEPGLIHTTFNQTVAATGRLTSTKPNIQNLPLEVLGDIFTTRFT